MKRSVCLVAGILFGMCVSAALAADAPDGFIKEADACGFVVDTTGSVVSEAMITATNGGRLIATASTLSDGSFHFKDSINASIDLKAVAGGFAPALSSVNRVHPAVKEGKCKSPLYVVLGKSAGSSFITIKKKLVPKLK